MVMMKVDLDLAANLSDFYTIKVVDSPVIKMTVSVLIYQERRDRAQRKCLLKEVSPCCNIQPCCVCVCVCVSFIQAG